MKLGLQITAVIEADEDKASEIMELSKEKLLLLLLLHDLLGLEKEVKVNYVNADLEEIEE